MSFNIFHDSDEIVYLNFAKGFGEQISSLGIYKEHSHKKTFSELLNEHRPDHFISHYLLGAFAKKLSLSLAQLNIILDFIFIISTYYIFTFFIYSITGSKNLKWEFVTISMLFFPYATSLENHFQLTPILQNSIVYKSMRNPPLILEAFETQFSILWMSLCLFIWSKSVLNNFYKLLLLGITHGIFMYIYVLGWICLFVFLVILLSIESIRLKISLKKFLINNFMFTISSLTISSYGIYQIAVLNFESYSYEMKEAISGIYYMPIEWTLLTIILLISYFCTSSNSKYSKPLLILTCTILTELILLNIQPIAQIFTASIYLSGLYIRPIITAMVFTLILNYDFKAFKRFKYCNLLFFISLNLITLFSSFEMLAANKLDDEHILKVNFIKNSNIKDKTFAVITFNPPFSSSTKESNVRWEPNSLAVMTQNYLLHENLFSLNIKSFREESILRELLLGLIFKGTPMLIRPCIEDVTTSPSQLYFLPWMITESSRINACNDQKEIILNPDPCSLSSKFSVDYILLERAIIQTLPDETLKLSTSKWQSPSGNYEIYSYDREKAIQYYCGKNRDS